MIYHPKPQLVAQLGSKTKLSFANYLMISENSKNISNKDLSFIGTCRIHIQTGHSVVFQIFNFTKFTLILLNSAEVRAI